MNQSLDPRRFIKNLAAHWFYSSGMLRAIESKKYADSCVVLMYHRVVDPDQESVPVQDGMYVQPETFAHHVSYLKSRYRLIDINELIDRLLSKRGFDGPTCHLTFDDGWRDNYQQAFAHLQAHRAPATIFLASDFIGTSRWFWPENLLYALQNRLSLGSSAAKTIDYHALEQVYHNPGISMERRINQVIDRVKDESHQAITTLAQALEMTIASRPAKRPRLLMNWDEIKRMSAARITFGSHTCSHAIMTKLDDEPTIDRELNDSRRVIAVATGQTVKAFCFPNGDSNDYLVGRVARNGYQTAFSGAHGAVAAGTDPLRLPRIGVHEDIAFNVPMLAARMTLPFF
jgi:peptidoglycan/xylan/chitin deacetylase (PgdA/CDA1 family)